MGFQIGDQDMIGIFPILEQRELPRLDGVLGYGAFHDHKTMLRLPSKRLISKFSCLPSVPQLFETAASGLGFDGGIFPGHDRIAASGRIEKLHDSPAKESRVRPNPDAGSANVLGSLGQTTFEKRHGPRAGRCVPRSQTPMPEFLEMGLEAQERMIGTSASFLGIVAYPCKLGLPMEGKNHGIQIEDQAGSGFGQNKQPGSEPIVHDDWRIALGGRRLRNRRSVD